MLFMVLINVQTPATLPVEERQRLDDAERDRALELIAEGLVLRLWRVVGQRSNYGIWQSDSLEQLHAAISTLPLFPFMRVEVTPLVAHPLMQTAVERLGNLPKL